MPRSCEYRLRFFFSCVLIFVVIQHADDCSAASDTTAIQEPVQMAKTAHLPAPDQPSHGPEIGETLPLWSCLPFACMLLSIALFPLLAPDFWHHHFVKISAFWAALMILPFGYSYRMVAVHQVLHILLADYVPFIILLWSLYTISGGIFLRGDLRATPVVNLLMLAIGTLMASFMGTTGAAMLIIRPFLRANSHRKNRTFMVVFFIFLIANIGGALTPLGDPPLFLGFLHGVPFFWPLHILKPMLTAAAILMMSFFVMDTYWYRKEKPLMKSRIPDNRESLSLAGWHNFLFLAGVVAAVLFSGIVKLGEVNTLGIHRAVQDWIRDGFLLLMGILSLITTSITIREDNQFTWFPIKEVAYLFIGIFITMIPCLAILKAGTKGHLAFLINAVQTPAHYFWAAGSLSAFLDNAPTYLTFFSTALGSHYPGMAEPEAVKQLILQNPVYLKAISAGSVFFGACSYIGNAPNFMVRSIAEESGTAMPSFFGYIFRYSMVFLIPVFVLITLIFF